MELWSLHMHHLIHRLSDLFSPATSHQLPHGEGHYCRCTTVICSTVSSTGFTVVIVRVQTAISIGFHMYGGGFPYIMTIICVLRANVCYRNGGWSEGGESGSGDGSWRKILILLSVKWILASGDLIRPVINQSTPQAPAFCGCEICQWPSGEARATFIPTPNQG